MLDRKELLLYNLRNKLGDAVPDLVEAGEIPALTRPLNPDEMKEFDQYCEELARCS